MTAPCCPGATLPATATATVTDSTGGAPGCGFTVGLSFSIPYVEVDACYEVFGSANINVGCISSIRMCCGGTSASDWTSDWIGGASGTSDSPTLMSASCDPFSFTFRYTLLPADVACCGGVNAAGTFDITFTA